MRLEATLLLLATVAVALPTNPNANDSERQLVYAAMSYQPQRIATHGHRLNGLYANAGQLNFDDQYDAMLQTDLAIHSVGDDATVKKMIDDMMQYLRDDMILLRRLLMDSFGRSTTQSSLPSHFKSVEHHPDLFVLLPLPEGTNEEELRRQLASEGDQIVPQDITKVTHGYLGLASQRNFVKTVDLVTRYLRYINNYDLLHFFQQNQSNPEYKYWAKVIIPNDSYMARYYFNDLMAFQVIPKIAVRYVAMRELELAIWFIDSIVDNYLLNEFFKSTYYAADINYYELAAYSVLAIHPVEAPDFLKKVQSKSGFNIDRLYYCAAKPLQTTLRNVFGSHSDIQQPQKTKYADCKEFKAQLERVGDIENSVIVFIENEDEWDILSDETTPLTDI